MASPLAQLVVSITANTGPLTASLIQVRSGLLGISGLSGGIGTALTGAFLAIGGAAAGVAGGLTYAIKQAIDLDSGFNQVRKTTGLGAEDMQTLRARIEQMATTMAGISIDELIKIAEVAGQVGVQGVEGISAFTESLAKISISIDDLDPATAARSIATILAQFRLGPAYAEPFASALDRLGDSSTATAGEILNVANRLSGVAVRLQMTPPQLLALATAMKEAGVSSETAGTAIQQIFMRMTTSTGAFARVAGMSVAQFTALLRSDPLEALRAVSQGLSGLDRLEQPRALKALGLEGQNVISAFLRLGNTLPNLTNNLAMANSEWQTSAHLNSQVAAAGNDTRNQMERLGNNIRITASHIGEMFIPAVRAAADLIGELATAARGMADRGGGALAGWASMATAAVQGAGVAFRNWPLFLELALVEIQSFAERSERLLWDFAGWVGENWASLLADDFMAVVQIWENFGSNVASIVSELFEYFKSGGTHEIKYQLKPLMEGVTFDTPAFDFEMPEEMEGFRRRREEIEGEISEAERLRQEDIQKAQDAARARAAAEKGEAVIAGGAPGAPGEAGAAAGTGTFEKAGRETARTEDLAGFARRLQESVFGKDDTAREQLREQKTTNEKLDRIAEISAAKPPGGTAAYAP